MVKWNLKNTEKAVAALSVPDGLGSVAHLEGLVASCPRPFVLACEREISVLRRGLTKDGWKRTLYLQPADHDPQSIYFGGGLLSVANQSLEIDTTIPQRGGHYHHFFCECGSRLVIPEDVSIAESYHCDACGSDYSGERFDDAIRYLQHQRLARAALCLALVYAIEKDRVYADKAAEILLNYAQAYPGPHTDLTTGGMFYQSLCEAVWAIPLAQAYDLIYYSRSLDDAQRDAVERNLFTPVAEGLRNVGAEGNWGSWHLSAVGVIGLSIRNASFVQYALDAFRSQMIEQLGEDGLWPESVHTYHFYPLAAFVHFAEACNRVGIDIYNWEVAPGKSLKAMFSAPLQYMYPCFRLPAINDGWYDSFLPLSLYEIAHRRWDDAAFAWVLKKAYRAGEAPANEDQRQHVQWFSRNSFYAFLFGRDLPGRTGTPSLKSADFSGVGLCTLRNGDDVMATLDYGPFLIHGHRDKLSFTLYANDALLVPDYGTPGFGSKLVRWSSDTPAHNTVVVDGKSQEMASDYGLTARYSGGFLQFAEAVAADVYPGVAHTRRLLLVGNACFVSDELESDEEHDYDWLCRVEGKPSPIGDLSPSQLDCARYPLIELQRAWRVDEACRIDWECSSGNLALAMWSHSVVCDGGLGLSPAETAARKVPVFVCRQHGKSARFTALLAPSRSDNLRVDKNGCVVSITEDEKADHVFLSGLGDAADGNGLRTDGQVAAVRTSEGEVYSIALVKGSWIEWNGERLLECPSTVDCVEVCFRERSPLIRYCCDTAGTVKLRTNARAMRINGHRTAATTNDGQALLRVTPQMLGVSSIDILS